MAHDCIEFEVCLTERPGTPREKKRWLTPGRKWTELESEALVIVMRRLPTMTERQKIQDRIEDLGGGPKKWLERGVTERELWTDLLSGYRLMLWGEAGPPEADTDEEEAAQLKLVEDAWAVDDRPAAEALRHLRRRNLQTRLMALWPVLVVNPPKGWASLDDLPDDPPDLLDLLSNAYENAIATAEAAEGN